MNSVERMKYYIEELPQERARRIVATKPRPSWPESGAIEFQHLQMRYRDGLPLVVDNISVSIKVSFLLGGFFFKCLFSKSI
jgi:ABC-type multidrug transport system fused ATPase/permease subunit